MWWLIVPLGILYLVWDVVERQAWARHAQKLIRASRARKQLPGRQARWINYERRTRTNAAKRCRYVTRDRYFGW